MNELVRMSTQEISKGIPVTDSLIVSERFEVSHLSVLRLIEKYSDDISQFGKLTVFQIPRVSQREHRAYELNEQQFSLLVMYMKNTKIAREYKMKFVKAFYFLRNEMFARQELRQLGKHVRKSLTDTIQDKLSEEGNFKHFAYSNYSKLIYKKVLGCTVKNYKEINNIAEGKNIRDFISIEQLEQIQEIESKIAAYIEMRTDLTKNDKEVYEEVKKYIFG
jgi:phage regulator Rha-like protein